jgi:hypothetical protein
MPAGSTIAARRASRQKNRPKRRSSITIPNSAISSAAR